MSGNQSRAAQLARKVCECRTRQCVSILAEFECSPCAVSSDLKDLTFLAGGALSSATFCAVAVLAPRLYDDNPIVCGAFSSHCGFR